jgi:nicotinate-nucleotide pyrophosphorylase (carboxylating)
MPVPHPGSREWRPAELLDSFAGWESVVQAALSEDAPNGDITTRSFIGTAHQVTWSLRSRESGVLAGKEVVNEVFNSLSGIVSIEWLVHDGNVFASGETLATLTGASDALLTGERVALNYLQRLSGIATRTRSYAEAVADSKAHVLDTRKTTPGLRAFEKYAVCCGGGRTHRKTLSDVVMIKDNHLAALNHDWKRVAEAVQTMRAASNECNGGHDCTHVEIEVDRLDQINAALQSGADSLLLDGFSLKDLRRAVTLVDGRVPLEASGGVTLNTIRSIAETGVDFISVGALTNGYPSIDIGLDAVED